MFLLYFLLENPVGLPDFAHTCMLEGKLYGGKA